MYHSFQAIPVGWKSLNDDSCGFKFFAKILDLIFYLICILFSGNYEKIHVL